jgi:hypothetical protein
MKEGGMETYEYRIHCKGNVACIVLGREGNGGTVRRPDRKDYRVLLPFLFLTPVHIEQVKGGV